MPSEETALERARKLLALALHPGTPEHEAKLAEEQADKLISKYALDRALLDAKSDVKVKPIVKTVVCEAPYARAKATLLYRVAKAYGVKTIIHTTERQIRGLPTSCDLVKVYGFESDVEAVELLYTHLLLQAAGAPEIQMGDRGFRRSFMLAFAHRVGTRLEALRAKDVADAEPGTALVLRNRDADVEDLFKQDNPRTRKTSASVSNAFGAHLGDRVGRTANLGAAQGSFKSQRAGIES